jgi:hypothetical protein
VKSLIQQELFTKIKLIGVESGVIEIEYLGTDVEIGFYDEDTGVSAGLYSIKLGEFSFIKESYVVGEFDLSRIKNSEDAEAVKKQLMDKGKKMEFVLVAKAKELAEEITKRAGIPVKVVPRLQGTPIVTTEFENNMWHASQVFEGIDDDY